MGVIRPLHQLKTFRHFSQTLKMSNFFSPYLWSLRDKRVDDWPLMSSPWATIISSLLYWIISLKLGPSFMSTRPAYELKKTIQFYNLIQILLSSYLFYECGVSGWFTHYNWLCQNIELDQNGLRMAQVSYMYYLSKFLEFCDTFFFILRKKDKHVSKLQLLHHGLMPIYGWILVRWLPGGHETFGGAFNSLVHVVMYLYYFLASFGLKIWWKKYLTTFQMFQFFCVFSHSAILVLCIVEPCGYPWQFSLVSLAMMSLFFVLFADFYVQSYSNKKEK